MTSNQKNGAVLAGDIGGTKTNLGIFLKGKKRPVLKVIETYPSRGAPNLESLIEKFLEKHKPSIASACFGIAGPVVNGRCKTTNLPWSVSEAQIKSHFVWETVRLINDLTATALAIPLLNSRELFPLNKTKALKERNIGLIAPGTGLGEALLIYRQGRYITVSSEGGHVDFSPNNKDEVKLWHYLHKRFGHVSIERVLSGPGLLNIYSWLKDSGQYKEPAWLSRKIKEGDPARVITEAAMNNKSPLCVKSLNMFVSILGAVAGNLALIGMTIGGVCLGGGIPPKILSKLKEDIFMNAFTDKGRFKDFMNKIPVRVILSDRTALIGAGHCALEMEGKQDGNFV
jgi:glucokinase